MWKLTCSVLLSRRPNQPDRSHRAVSRTKKRGVRPPFRERFQFSSKNIGIAAAPVGDPTANCGQEVAVAPKMYGPLPVAPESIERHLQANSAGVYALGKIVQGTFIAQLVGRSDDDLRSGIKSHLRGRHKHFKFSYALSARDAFEKECELYHSLVILDQPHPTPAENTDWKCKACFGGRRG